MLLQLALLLHQLGQRLHRVLQQRYASHTNHTTTRLTFAGAPTCHATHRLHLLHHLLHACLVRLDGVREQRDYASRLSPPPTRIVLPERVLRLVQIERRRVGDDHAVVVARQQVVHQRLRLTRLALTHLIVRRVLQCRHQVDVAVQKNQQWVAETRALVPLDVREQADSGFLPISGMREITTIWSRMREDSVEAIMLAAPLGEQRMVGMAESDMTRESSS